MELKFGGAKRCALGLCFRKVVVGGGTLMEPIHRDRILFVAFIILGLSILYPLNSLFSHSLGLRRIRYFGFLLISRE